MTDAPPHRFRTPREAAAFAAVSTELAARIRHRPLGRIPESEFPDWGLNLLSDPIGWESLPEARALRAFREPTHPEVAVVADALIHAGTVTETLYARLLAAANRQQHAGKPVIRAVAFDAFGTLARIGRRRRPFERLVQQARDQARSLPSPMTAPIGLADYAALLGLDHPVAELAMLGAELMTIELYPDARDVLRRVREQGLTVAVASNLAEPYAAPLMALLGSSVDVWHFSFACGAIKPWRAFYAALTDRLGIEAHELLMVGDTWKDDVAGAADAGAHARWLDREGRGGYVRRHITVRSLDDIDPDLASAATVIPSEPA